MPDINVPPGHGVKNSRLLPIEGEQKPLEAVCTVTSAGKDAGKESLINQTGRVEMWQTLCSNRKEGLYDIAQRGNIMESYLGSCFVSSFLLCRSEKAYACIIAFSRERTGFFRAVCQCEPSGALLAYDSVFVCDRAAVPGCGTSCMGAENHALYR